MEEIQLGAIGNDGSGDPLARQSAALNRNFAETVDATSSRTITIVDPTWDELFPRLYYPSDPGYQPGPLSLRYEVPPDSWEERLEFSQKEITAVYRDGETWFSNSLSLTAQDFTFYLNKNPPLVGGINRTTKITFLGIESAGMGGCLAITTAETAIFPDSGSVTATVFLRSLNGTTAERPTLPNVTRWPVGAQYFDTSLGSNGKPIWVNKAGTGWVDAAGASV